MLHCNWQDPYGVQGVVTFFITTAKIWSRGSGRFVYEYVDLGVGNIFTSDATKCTTAEPQGLKH